MTSFENITDKGSKRKEEEKGKSTLCYVRGLRMFETGFWKGDLSQECCSILPIPWTASRRLFIPLICNLTVAFWALHSHSRQSNQLDERTNPSFCRRGSRACIKCIMSRHSGNPGHADMMLNYRPHSTAPQLPDRLERLGCKSHETEASSTRCPQNGRGKGILGLHNRGYILYPLCSLSSFTEWMERGNMSMLNAAVLSILDSLVPRIHCLLHLKCLSSGRRSESCRFAKHHKQTSIVGNRAGLWSILLFSITFTASYR